MTAAAVTLSRPAFWAGLTVYVAFLLTQSANAQEGRLRVEREDGQLRIETQRGGLGLEDGSDAEPESRIGDLNLDDDERPEAAVPPLPPPPPGTPTPYGPLPPPAPPFRDTVYGAHASPGPPGGPSFLHPNFPEYQTRYGIWYQPRSFWEPTREVYRPQAFRPRGWGNVFVEDPCRHDRMDYNRYVVKDLPSRYGPSYYPLYQPPSECVIFRPELAYDPPVHGTAE